MSVDNPSPRSSPSSPAWWDKGFDADWDWDCSDNSAGYGQIPYFCTFKFYDPSLRVLDHMIRITNMIMIWLGLEIYIGVFVGIYQYVFQIMLVYLTINCYCDERGGV